MRGTRRKYLRVYQLFPRPDSGKRIEPVRKRLAENHHIRFHMKLGQRPELPRAVKAHLDFIVDQENVMTLQDFLKIRKIFLWRNHIAAGALNRLDIKSAVFRLIDLGIQNAVVLGFKKFLKLFHTVHPAIGIFFSVRTAEAIRIRNKMRLVGKMAEAAAVAVARSDRRGTEGSSVITAHKSENKALPRMITDQFQRIFDRLRTTHVEMHAALKPK